MPFSTRHLCKSQNLSFVYQLLPASLGVSRGYKSVGTFLQGHHVPGTQLSLDRPV